MLTQLVPTLRRASLRPASVHFNPGRWFPRFCWRLLLLLSSFVLLRGRKAKFGPGDRLLLSSGKVTVTHSHSFWSSYLLSLLSLQTHILLQGHGAWSLLLRPLLHPAVTLAVNAQKNNHPQSVLYPLKLQIHLKAADFWVNLTKVSLVYIEI